MTNPFTNIITGRKMNSTKIKKGNAVWRPAPFFKIVNSPCKEFRFTQVTASLPKPYFDLIRILIAKNKASPADVVQYILCVIISGGYVLNLPEYHFDLIPGSVPKRS